MFCELTRSLKKSLRNQKGFTLVELIVVVIILAILAAIMVPKLLPYTQQARVSRALGDMATMKTIIEAYAAEYGQGYYPAAGGSQSDPTKPGASIANVLQAAGVQWGSLSDPWGNAYQYTAYTSGSNIVGWSITSAGPDKAQNTSDDIYVSDIYSPQQGSVPSPLTGSGGTGGTPVPSK
ncbi:prepilin-type N-terminal cleavage/methylation domain-containing protein [Desulfofundulus thermobenzoicus]|uniref:Prepilin-type N-terminal cleavage/methylation domain-containing protein n=1 Tax=Desulfofundulus thermobenzoicus TaxID=29376 RepID=A0A6N7IN89_9FIRM|nr:prepilin-type N-terminal cleavage/methylation domain-containing protein [Desulfofundulus thermobenzoicus]MQL51067.1 prepilin-type N-terminal cleavage/methylation domain-containing protein [Desulfofundulus thermobenzoicus]